MQLNLFNRDKNYFSSYKNYLKYYVVNHAKWYYVHQIHLKISDYIHNSPILIWNSGILIS